jgi:protein ImuB
MSDADRVLGACPLAAAAGVRPGRRSTQARLLCPELRMTGPDAMAATILYEDLLVALSTVSPLVEATDAATGMAYLDGRGLERLIGDPPALVQATRVAAATVGVTIRAGSGPTRLLAHVVARRASLGNAPASLPDHEAWRLLRAMPIGDPLFALPPPILEQFDELGLRTAGALAAVPRAALALRFEDAVPVLWDALHDAPEPPLRPWCPPAVLTARHASEEGVDDRLRLDTLVANLAGALLGQLVEQGKATAQLTLRLQHADGTRRIARRRQWPPLAVGGPLQRAAAALLDQALAPSISQPVSVLRLDAGALGPALGSQTPLFGDPLDARRDRLRAALTDQADRHGASVLGRWRLNPLDPEGWTLDDGPP